MPTPRHRSKAPPIPRASPDSHLDKMTELVQTHVTPRAIAIMNKKLEKTGQRQALYLRRLIMRDLGMIEDHVIESE